MGLPEGLWSGVINSLVSNLTTNHNVVFAGHVAVPVGEYACVRSPITDVVSYAAGVPAAD